MYYVLFFMIIFIPTTICSMEKNKPKKNKTPSIILTRTTSSSKIGHVKSASDATLITTFRDNKNRNNSTSKSMESPRKKSRKRVISISGSSLIKPYELWEELKQCVQKCDIFTLKVKIKQHIGTPLINHSKNKNISSFDLMYHPHKKSSLLEVFLSQIPTHAVDCEDATLKQLAQYLCILTDWSKKNIANQYPHQKIRVKPDETEINLSHPLWLCDIITFCALRHFQSYYRKVTNITYKMSTIKPSLSQYRNFSIIKERMDILNQYTDRLTSISTKETNDLDDNNIQDVVDRYNLIISDKNLVVSQAEQSNQNLNKNKNNN